MILRYLFKKLSINGDHSHNFKFLERSKAGNSSNTGRLCIFHERDYVCKKCGYKIGINYEIIDNTKVVLDESLYIFVSDSIGWQNYKNEDYKLLTCNQVIMKKACE